MDPPSTVAFAQDGDPVLQVLEGGPDVSEKVLNTEVKYTSQDHMVLVSRILDVTNGGAVMFDGQGAARELAADASAILEILVERANGQHGVTHSRLEVAELHDKVCPKIGVSRSGEDRADVEAEELECSPFALVMSPQLLWAIPGETLVEAGINEVVAAALAPDTCATGTSRLCLVTLDLADP